MTSILATATSHGWASPDVDQTEPWVTVRRVLPSPLHRVMDHRGITHWWGTAVAAWWGIGYMPPGAQWPACALLIGWVSHLLGDFIFGVLPVLPLAGGLGIGLGLDTGGFLETGTVKIRGHRRKVLPSPVRVLIAVALLWVLAAGVPAFHQLSRLLSRK